MELVLTFTPLNQQGGVIVALSNPSSLVKCFYPHRIYKKKPFAYHPIQKPGSLTSRDALFSNMLWLK